MKIPIVPHESNDTLAQTIQWLNELRLIERLGLFESKEERKELQKMLASARKQRDLTLFQLESV